MKKSLPGVVTALALTPATPTAHADDQQFLNDLYEMNYPMVSGPARAVWGGHRVCESLQGGLTHEQIAASANFLERPAIDQYIAAAQLDICPDTLR